MNKKEFMRKLKECLVGMDQTDKREILLDYEEHFLDGLKEGRTEEEICASLGEPKELALNLKKASADSNKGNDGMSTGGYIIGLIALTFGCIWLVSFIFSLAGTIFGGAIGIVALTAMPLQLMLKITAISAVVFGIAISLLIVLAIIKLIVLICRWYKHLINSLSKADEKPIKKEFKMIRIPAWIWIVLAVICVISFGGMIFGGINFGVDAIKSIESGEADEAVEIIDDILNDIDFEINNLEDLEKLEQLEQLERLEELEPLGFIFNDDFDGNLRRFGFMNFFTIGASSVDISEELDFSGVKNIYVGAKSAKITIVKGSEGKATLTGRSSHRNEKIYIDKSGDTLNIEVQKNVKLVGLANLDFEIVVPDDVYESLKVRNISGYTEIQGVNIKNLDVKNTSGRVYVDGDSFAIENADISSVSGSVKVENIDSDGYIKIKSTSGSVQMDNLKTGTIDVHCTSGSIKGYDVSGVMQIKDTSGSINIDGELKDGASNISSVSGSINITISKRP